MKSRVPRAWIAATLLLMLAPAPGLLRAKEASPAPAGPFLVKPYLQLGDVPTPDSLRLLWHADDISPDAAGWSVEYRPGADRPWTKAGAPTSRRVAVAGIAPHRIYRATLAGLEPGGAFAYRVSRKGREVFAAEGKAPRGKGQPYRFVAFGDCGAGTPEQKTIAFRAYQTRPDFLMIPGDIVYGRGRISEYRENFWPVYNADEASPAAGVPMLRSTLFVAAPGNHDVASRDMKTADLLAYFYFWDQPLNGPDGGEGGALCPKLTGPQENQGAFRSAAGAAYPRLANFSFDYGNAHWTVLDSNPYVDWTDRDLRAWVEKDLAAAQGATWRFVTFHHPGFNSARTHYEDQQMRRLAGVLEAGKVDVVFAGHVHNYQRTYPLRFSPGKPFQDTPPVGKDGKPIARGSRLVPGHWTLDKSFDGRDKTRADGVIYLVTGAGGQHLYDPEQEGNPGTWQEFTRTFISKLNTLTVADVDGPTMTVRQLSADGAEVDRFVVTK